MINNRGFLILAVNTGNVDYVKCAARLADSIKFWHPNESICLLTDQPPQQQLSQFDVIKLLPQGDQSQYSWKLDNDWQVWSASPYKRTIKLEADMLLTSPIDHWWSALQDRDLVLSQGARNYFGEITQDRTYRALFDKNNLPDVYNAITYWAQSWLARDFFRLVRNIFQNWTNYQQLLNSPDAVPTTDVVYGIAANILGPELCTLPKHDHMTVVHMKKNIIPLTGSDWTRELVWEFDHNQLRINTIPQCGFFHYHIKSWVDQIENFTRTH